LADWKWLVGNIDPIAIIEDDDPFRIALGDLLEVAGYSCRLYRSAEAFLDDLGTGLGKQAFACVITDYRLPGMNGLDLHKALGARGHAVPMLLMSSDLSPRLAARALQQGFSAALSKPLAEAQLTAQIDAAITTDRSGGADRDEGSSWTQ
jgi:FixJ family two-component response regulator